MRLAREGAELDELAQDGGASLELVEEQHVLERAGHELRGVLRKSRYSA